MMRNNIFIITGFLTLSMLFAGCIKDMGFDGVKRLKPTVIGELKF